MTEVDIVMQTEVVEEPAIVALSVWWQDARPLLLTVVIPINMSVCFFRRNYVTGNVPVRDAASGLQHVLSGRCVEAVEASSLFKSEWFVDF